MNYHVFIVDKTTFKYHLEYLFAGTGAKDRKALFLSNASDTTTHHTTERNLVGMVADISRIRIGDKIIFYLQAKDKTPGQFYGVFKASSVGFFDENNNDNYLKDSLGKALTFRVKIEADFIYPKGVSEHSYLDSLDEIKYPHEMCWSLIYRKLKGNRGCTMITEYEYNNLLFKLGQVNADYTYPDTIKSFTFNETSNTIEPLAVGNLYAGAMNSLSIKDRLVYAANKKNKFEVHLQAYIMQNFDTFPLNNTLLPFPAEDCWIGNEVSCGVGMQRIDILIQQEIKNEVYIKIIELKCVSPDAGILERQLPWYIQWLSFYMIPNYTLKDKIVHLIPSIIALGENKEFTDKCELFDYSLKTQYSGFILEPTEYIAINYDKNDIVFKKTK